MSPAILTTAISLTAVFTAPMWVKSLRVSQDDFMDPVLLTSVLNLVTIVPYLTFVAFDPSVVSAKVRFHQSVGDLDRAVPWYGLIQAASYIAMLLAFHTRVPDRIAARFPVVGYEVTERRLLGGAAIAIAAGGGSFLYFLSLVGGLDFLLNNLHRRVEITAGYHYLLSLVSVFSFGVLLLVDWLRYRISTARLAIVLTLLVAGVFMFSSTGGRKNSLFLVIFALFVWHCRVRRIRRPLVAASVFAAFFVPYFIALPLLRNEEGTLDTYLSYPHKLVADVVDNAEVVVTQLSYVDQYILITSHYDLNNIWWGRSYLDLALAPIPSSLLEDKPPVDDGIYLRTLAEGEDVRPSMGRSHLFYSSWPPETLGIMYMNWWLPGVLLGSAFVAAVMRGAYAYARHSRWSLFSIILYGFVILNFEVSNLRIVQTIVTVLLLLLFFATAFGLRFPDRGERGWKPA